MNLRPARPFASVLLVACFAGAATAQEGTQGGEWRHYAGDKASTKYSALDQIDASNAGELSIAWRWDSPANALEKKLDNRLSMQNSFEPTPLYVDGILYTSTNYSQVAAIDPATGKTLWLYDPVVYTSGRPANYGFMHRGIEYWTDGTISRILITTGDRRLISVDTETGKSDPNFGVDGEISLVEGLERAHHIGSYTNYSPSIVCRDTVVVGSIIADRATHQEAPEGHVRGYDVRTGEQRWIFHSIPQAGEFGVETWENDSWKYTGNTNVWSMMSADEELGYVYLPFGCPTNDAYGGHRLGDNLFANSVVCVNAETGERVWHYQTVHHDLWDFDLPAAPNLMDIEVDGKQIKALAQITKQGFVFVLDRETGEPVWPIEERPVPKSTLEGERTSPTQPHPTRPEPFASQGIFEDDVIDFTPELRAKALAIIDGYVHGELFTPPSTDYLLQNPGIGGGANWTGAAFDPDSHIFYIPSRLLTLAYQEVKPDPARSNMKYVRNYGGDTWGPFVDGLPLLKPPYASVTAYDMNSGNKLWVTTLGDGPRDHPTIKHLKLPPLGDTRLWRPLLTKTLLFMVNSSGERPELWTLNKDSGEVVSRMDLPKLGNRRGGGTPMTYLHEGKQYIVAAMGGDGQPAELVALALADATEH